MLPVTFKVSFFHPLTESLQIHSPSHEQTRSIEVVSCSIQTSAEGVKSTLRLPSVCFRRKSGASALSNGGMFLTNSRKNSWQIRRIGTRFAAINLNIRIVSNGSTRSHRNLLVSTEE